MPDNLCVARPVGKAEIERTPAAKAAMKKEWDRLRSQDVQDESASRKSDDVRVEAKSKGCAAHMGNVWYLYREEL